MTLRALGRADLAAVVVILAMGATTLDVARRAALCADEPAHVGAGFSYIQHGEVYLGGERPPLFRLVVGLLLHGLGVEEGPAAAAVYERGRNPPPGWAPPLHYYGKVLLVDENQEFKVPGAAAGTPSLALAARLPTIAATLLLVALCWGWARASFGPVGGLITATLVATHPDVLGYGALAHTDVPVTTACVAAAWTFERLARRGGLSTLLLLGLLVGAACMIKVTALFLLPALGLAALVAARTPADPASSLSLVHPFAAGSPPARVRALLLAAATCAAVALVVVWAAWLGAPLDGLRVPQPLVKSDYVVNCLGRYRAWTAPYFVVAFALKVPLTTGALLALAAWAAWRGQRLQALGEVVLLAPAVTIFVLVTWTAPQIGTRLILPAVPFLLVSAGRLGPWLEGHRTRAGLVGLLLAASVVGAALDHPWHATRLNALAGEPRRAHRLLDESNLDLGGAVAAIGAWQVERGVDEVVLVSNTPLHDAAFLRVYGVRGVVTLDITPLHAPEPGRVYLVSRHTLSRAALEAQRGGPPLVLGGARDADGLLGDLVWFDLRAR